MRAIRLFAILIGFIVLTHSGVMAMDPHGLHGNGHDTAHETVFALVCDEKDGITGQARIAQDLGGVSFDRPATNHPVPNTDAHFIRGWNPPAVTGETLRALLQVFLN